MGWSKSHDKSAYAEAICAGNAPTERSITWEAVHMVTVKIRQEDEYIKLGQALKKADIVSSGVDAKIFIQGGNVEVNGEVELQRGKKLHDGDVVTFHGETIQIVK